MYCSAASRWSRTHPRVEWHWRALAQCLWEGLNDRVELQRPSPGRAAPRNPTRQPKQKVSGCFRSTDGAHAFATIRSYLSTLHKQSIDAYQALVKTFQGHPPMPQLV